MPRDRAALLETRRAPIGAVEGRTLTGYAAKFNEWSKPLQGARGEFREKIDPSAFDGRGDVSLWWMHDPKQPLANTQSGTLTLTTDETGLRYEAVLGESAQAQHFLDLVQRGVVSEMSFGFRVPDGGDSWQGRDRTLKRVELREVSLVEVGAYAGTSAEARNEPAPKEPKPMTLKEIQSALALAKDEETRAADDDGKLAAMLKIEELTEQRAKLIAQGSAALKIAPDTAPAPKAPRFQSPESRAADDLARREEYRGSIQYRDEFLKWMKHPAEARELITTSSSSVMIPKIYEDGLLKYLQAETKVRNLADLKTGCQGNVTLRYNAAESATLPSAFWTTETSPTTTAVDMSVSEVNLPPIGGLAYSDVSHWLINSANFDVESEVMMHLQSQIAKQFEASYVGGTGSNQPTGLFVVDSGVNITTATSSGTTRALAITAGATIAKLQDMYYTQLPASHWGSAVWVMPQDFYAAVSKLVTGVASDLRPIFVQSFDTVLTGSAPFTLFGRPIYVTEYLPTHSSTGTTGKNCVCCLGRISDAFSIREWGGISIMRDDITLRDTGRVHFTALAFAASKLTRKKALVQLQVTNA